VSGNFEQRGQFWYRPGSTSHPYEWKTCEGCGRLRLIQRRSDPTRGRFCSRSCLTRSRTGTAAAHWRGDDAEYTGQHFRVYRERGKAAECVWGCQADHYEWANLTGDYLDVWDFASMCRRCHKRFDGAIRMMREDQDGRSRRWYPGRLYTRHLGPPR
jgi:hypothetical protein